MVAHLASFHGPLAFNGSVKSAALIRWTPGVNAVRGTRPVRLPAAPVPMETKVRNAVPPSSATHASSDSRLNGTPIFVTEAISACVPLGKLIDPLRTMSGSIVRATLADAVAPVPSVTWTVQVRGKPLITRAVPTSSPTVSLHPVLQLYDSGAVPVDWRASMIVPPE